MTNKPATRAQDAYYYAGGERITLSAAPDLLAIDEAQLDGATISAKIRAKLKKIAQPLMSGVQIIDRSILDEAHGVEELLSKIGALQPVYRSRDATIIVMPEVRVEVGNDSTNVQRLTKWLKKHAGKASIESSPTGYFIIRPSSRYGGDALKMANALIEELHPQMAQARFIRIVGRPSASTQGK